MQPEIVHSSVENRPFTWAWWVPALTDEDLLSHWALLNTAEEMPEIKAPHRRREWLATRILLHQLGLNKIEFLPNGKPMHSGGALSISHCGGAVSVALSESVIGLDIQKPIDRIYTIRSKFCSASEWLWLEKHDEPLRALTIVWSAKEAIFKYWGEQVEFAEHIEVLPFQCNDPFVIARYTGTHGQRDFRLWHTTREGLEVVIAV